MTTRNEDLAWAAGFFDGEGCTTLSRRGVHAHLRCAVSQKDRRALDKFHAIVELGTIYHSKKQTPWRWQTTRELDAIEVMGRLWPWLDVVKREQFTRKVAESTWHNGQKDQLVCRDSEHVIVPRKNGGRRCQTCQNAYFKAWRERNPDYYKNRKIAS